MTRLLTIVCSALVAVLASASIGDAKPPAGQPSLRRYAIVIGSNAGGGTTRDQLRYALKDAGKIADVLRQLGGVTQLDLSLPAGFVGTTLQVIDASPYPRACPAKVACVDKLAR